MGDIDLGQVGRPDGEPDPEPPDDRSRSRWLPAWWPRRPVPRSLVAVVSALVAAVAVAVYLDRRAEEPAEVTEPAPLLVPERWLQVSEPFPPPHEQGSDATRQRWREAIAQHPAGAVLTLPLERYQPRLAALPPGTYRVQAGCELAERPDPELLPGPVELTVDIWEAARPHESLATVRCDGTVRTVRQRLEVSGNHAFFSEATFFEGREAREVGFEALQQADPVVVVVSFTPA